MKITQINKEKNTLIPFEGSKGGLWNMEFELGENLIRNGGYDGEGCTDFVDTDGDGLADGFDYINGDCSIENGQKVAIPTGEILARTTISNIIKAGARYYLKIKHTNDNTFYIRDRDGNVNYYSSSAQSEFVSEFYFISINEGIYFRISGSPGESFTISEIELREVKVKDNSGLGNDLTVYGAPEESYLGSLKGLDNQSNLGYLRSNKGIVTHDLLNSNNKIMFGIAMRKIGATGSGTANIMFGQTDTNGKGFYLRENNGGIRIGYLAFNWDYDAIALTELTVGKNFVAFIVIHNYKVEAWINGKKIGEVTFDVNQFSFIDDTVVNLFSSKIDGTAISGYISSSVPFASVNNYTDLQIEQISKKLMFLSTHIGIWKGIDYYKKALECTSDGVAYIPSTTAYGEWEFEWYKGGELNASYYSFISDRVGGTHNFLGNFFVPNQDEIIYFNKVNNGSSTALFFTGSSYISNSTWYRIKIKRSQSGLFEVYIKGGTFGDWTLVGSATDNTYTTSKYFVLDMDTGDKFRNLTINGKPIDLNDFIISTGSYSVIDEAGVPNYAQSKNLINRNGTILNDTGTIAYWIDYNIIHVESTGGESSVRPMLQLNFLTVGKTYLLSYSVIQFTGTVKHRLYDGSSYVYTDIGDLSKSIAFEVKSGTSFFAISGEFEFTEDIMVSIVEIHEKYSELRESNFYRLHELQSGDFADLDGEKITDASDWRYSSQLITNGTFEGNADNWSLSSGVTYNSNQINFNTSSNETLIQNINLINGKKYRIRYRITSYTSGGLWVYQNFNGAPEFYLYGNSIGVFEGDLIYTGTSGIVPFYLRGKFSIGFVGSIDNVEVYELSENDEQILIYAPLPTKLRNNNIEEVELDHDELYTVHSDGMEKFDLEKMYRVKEFNDKNLTNISVTNSLIAYSGTGEAILVDLGEQFTIDYMGAVSEIKYNDEVLLRINGLTKEVEIVGDLKVSNIKHGEVKASTVSLDTAQYLEAQFNGQSIKIALITED